MALAYDSSGALATGTAGASTQNWTHTPVGSSNLVGFVGAYIEKTGDAATETITGITWGGNAMVQVNKKIRNAGGGWEYLYRTGNGTPPSGAQTVEITCGANAYIKGMSVVYTGGLQSSFTGGQNTAAAAGNSLDVVVAVDATVNSWVVAFGLSDNGGVGAGTGMTSRITSEGVFIFGDSNGTVTPSSNYTIGLVGTGSGNEIINAAQFYPATGTAYSLSAVTGAFALAGVAVGIAVGYLAAMAVGAFTLTGVDVTLSRAFNTTISCEAGEFTLSGSNVSLSQSSWSNSSPSASSWTDRSGSSTPWTSA